MENSKQITRFRWRDAKELEKTMNATSISVDFSSLPKNEDGDSVLDMTTCKSNRVSIHIPSDGCLQIKLPVAGVLKFIDNFIIDTINEGYDILVINETAADRELRILVIGNVVILADNGTLEFNL